jgi:regulatory protein
VRDYKAEDIDIVVEYLLVENYLSNERFAESIFRTRVGRGYGWLFIQNELAQKGVNSSIINDLRINQEIDWYLQAELAYNKRFGITAIVDQKDKAKRVRFLQSRGFSTDEIFSAL